nr:MAG TPA: hypothetical protein [Bacteriophage sp.]
MIILSFLRIKRKNGFKGFFDLGNALFMRFPRLQNLNFATFSYF